MNFEWDEAKRLKNIDQHDVDFIDTADFFTIPQSVICTDTRRQYDEDRLILFCEKDGVLFQTVYTIRGERIRIISSRRGNKRERRRYEKAQKDRTNH
jgi:uncharacterized DUF497 family protein